MIVFVYFHLSVCIHATTWTGYVTWSGVHLESVQYRWTVLVNSPLNIVYHAHTLTNTDLTLAGPVRKAGNSILR